MRQIGRVKRIGYEKDSGKAVFFVPRAGLEPARPFRAKGFSDKPKFFCLQNQFRSVCDVEFDEQFFAVPVDGFCAEEEGLTNLFRSVSFCKQDQDIVLAVSY